MELKKRIGKLSKYAGNIITILAIVMIIKKLYTSNVDFSIIFSRSNITFFCAITIIYILLILISGIPWLNFVNALSGNRISYLEVVFIFIKSNILKYIPGNIFQYVGRNELAIEKKMDHMEVALATMADVACYIFTGLLIAYIMAGKELRVWIQEQGIFAADRSLVLFLGAAIVLVSVVIFFVYKKKKEKLKEIISKIMGRKFWGTVVLDSFFYAFLGMAVAALYVAVFSVISEEMYSIYEIATYIGIMQTAHVVGFVTPGAPGGIGIREAISLFLLKGKISESTVLSGIVIVRILFIIGDFMAYVLVVFWKKLRGGK